MTDQSDDLTRELTASREELHVREERLSSILNAAVDAIITIDRQGVITGVNPAAVRMFGFAQAEMVGSNVAMLMPAPYADEHDGYIKRYLESREPHIIGIGREVTAIRKDGTIFPAHLAVSEIDHLEMFTGIVRDLSELKSAQEKLVQSERLAAIGQMMTGLAHESRNALQRTRACLDMLELELSDEPDNIDLIHRGQTALDELHRLYEEVRGYAAPIRLAVRECDLSQLWRTAWQNLVFPERESSIELQQDVGSADLHCRLDPYRVGQVIRIILENAIAAVPEPGVIRIECADTDIEGRAGVRILFRDNGPGFPADRIDRIFEPFFTTKSKGTGLGMAIAKRIVEAHGGLIDVANLESGGAQVELTLPRSAQVDPPDVIS